MSDVLDFCSFSFIKCLFQTKNLKHEGQNYYLALFLGVHIQLFVFSYEIKIKWCVFLQCRFSQLFNEKFLTYRKVERLVQGASCT